MSEREILELLRDLFSGAVLSRSASDDPSGLHTEYTVDQERLLSNIADRLNALRAESGEWPRP